MSNLTVTNERFRSVSKFRKSKKDITPPPHHIMLYYLFTQQTQKSADLSADQKNIRAKSQKIQTLLIFRSQVRLKYVGHWLKTKAFVHLFLIPKTFIPLIFAQNISSFLKLQICKNTNQTENDKINKYINKYSIHLKRERSEDEAVNMHEITFFLFYKLKHL